MKKASQIFTKEERKYLEWVWDLFHTGPERTEVFDEEVSQ